MTLKEQFYNYFLETDEWVKYVVVELFTKDNKSNDKILSKEQLQEIYNSDKYKHQEMIEYEI